MSNFNAIENVPAQFKLNLRLCHKIIADHWVEALEGYDHKDYVDLLLKGFPPISEMQKIEVFEYLIENELMSVAIEAGAAVISRDYTRSVCQYMENP
jgi:hypothetical protein